MIPKGDSVGQRLSSRRVRARPRGVYALNQCRSRSPRPSHRALSEGQQAMNLSDKRRLMPIAAARLEVSP